jgi:hypothetical protein
MARNRSSRLDSMNSEPSRHYLFGQLRENVKLGCEKCPRLLFIQHPFANLRHGRFRMPLCELSQGFICRIGITEASADHGLGRNGRYPSGGPFRQTL